MIGAIAGDIIGSVYEWHNIKTTDFPLFSPNSKFTDDTVMTVAVADCLLNNKNYTETLKYYGRTFPNVGYGDDFYNWIKSRNDKPNNSYGIGAAMRISPIGYIFNDIESICIEAEKMTVISHNHPEAVKGAQAIAVSIFLSRNGKSKIEIRDFIEHRFGYSLSRRLDDIRLNYKYNESCQGLVPEAITSFLESENYEDAIRKAISLGGDSDTMACVTGGIAEAFYGDIACVIIAETKKRLPSDLLDIIDQFEQRINLIKNKNK
jgi:ADP-ribosylglycohydrolase